jgi:hypothetical protein
MIQFQANIDDNGSQQTISEMTDVLLDVAVPAIKAKAEEQNMLCSVQININVNLTPMVE